MAEPPAHGNQRRLPANQPETEKPERHYDQTIRGYAYVEGQWQLAVG